MTEHMDFDKHHLRLMGYFYGELSDKERSLFEAELAKNPALRKELEELRSTSKMLDEIPAPELASFAPIEFRSQKSTTAQALPAGTNNWWKRPLAAAASVLLIFLGGYATNFSAAITDDGFFIGFGNSQQPETVSPELLQRISDLYELQTEQLQAFITESETRRDAALQQSMASMATFVEEQRRSDLYLIQMGLEDLREQTDWKFTQAGLLMSELYQNVTTNKN